MTPSRGDLFFFYPVGFCALVRCCQSPPQNCGRTYPPFCNLEGTRGLLRDDLFNPCPPPKGNAEPGAAPPEAPLALGRGKAGARVRAQAVRETHLHHWRVGGSSSSCLIAGVRSDGSFSVAVKGVYRKGIQTDGKAFFFFLLPVAVILVS